ncbi:hypothetical protein DPSP01_011696 [Paraphaeosphaeria sporulosa]
MTCTSVETTTLLKVSLRTRPSVSETSFHSHYMESNRSSPVTWQNLTYTIPYERNERTLLQDVQGYLDVIRNLADANCAGGRTVYFGELGHDNRTLLDYLERNGAKKCPPKENPAEYMLEAIGAGDPNYKGKDWGDDWASSSENERLTQEIQEIISNRRNAAKDEVRDDRRYAMPLTTQLATVIHRNFVQIWRDPPYVMGLTMLHIITGLFNGFKLWHLGNSQIDMQSRLFSTFLTLTISPPLIQQLQPRFIRMRSIYSSREGNAKIYSWPAFMWGTILSELPYRVVAGTIYWCCWYWTTWFTRDTYTSASVWLFIMVFEVYYLGFGQAIAAFAPNELLASLMVPLFFTFIAGFCGVVVPYAALPTVWRRWMYWLSPFHYLLAGFLALLVRGQPIVCDIAELAIFPPPPGQDCQTYAGGFAQQSGGYVQTQPNGDCGYCQYATGDAFAASFNVSEKNIWRDFGIMWIFIFNFFVVFLGTWLCLGGARKIKSVFSQKDRKDKKEVSGKRNRDKA